MKLSNYAKPAEKLLFTHLKDAYKFKADYNLYCWYKPLVLLNLENFLDLSSD